MFEERELEEIVSGIVTSMVGGIGKKPNANPRAKLLEIGGLIYDRKLSDAAGGNLTCRYDGKIYITPRYMGEQHRYNIEPDDIIVTNLDGSIVDGDPDMITREGSAHFAVYRKYPQVNGVIHAHPRNILPFATTGVNIPPITEMLEHFGVGEIEICKRADPATPALAETIIEYLDRKVDALDRFGAAVMIPKHGILVAGKDLDYAYTILESIETAAYVYMQSCVLKGICNVST
ncbi:MAG: class II aldolase/adducin family protein [Candidatus Latescibacteria bacterium]|nr:class II aldolase/adducin family protein [Candidatus Latescibacterota bacterium]